MIQENLYTANCIRTFTGKYVNIFDPQPEMFCIEDIAHALTNQCRFGGHLTHFYSVAQHSIMVANIVHGDELKLDALMHDCSEAYLMDLPKPIKDKIPQYLLLEHELMKVLSGVFHFSYPLPETVKIADKLRLEQEWEFLMLGKSSFKIDDPEKSFLTAFDMYSKLK